MKISIITPSYNQGSFIEDAIRSVLDQGYENFEHIIVDGGSKDDTVQRLQKYSHLKWISEKDDGQSDALNKGFKMATGDIIGWLNCDDYYLPGAFHDVIETMKSKQVDGVYGDILFCNAQKEITGSKRSHRTNRILSLFYSYVNSETLFFRRSIIEQNIGIDKSFHICMDKEFIAHLLFRSFKLRYVPKPLAVFRWHETNKSMNTPAVRKTRIREGIRIFNRYNGRIRLNEDSPWMQTMYVMAINALRPLRIFLKLTS